jgi:hypothetical protein
MTHSDDSVDWNRIGNDYFYKSRSNNGRIGFKDLEFFAL